MVPRGRQVDGEQAIRLFGIMRIINRRVAKPDHLCADRLYAVSLERSEMVIHRHSRSMFDGPSGMPLAKDGQHSVIECAVDCAVPYDPKCVKSMF